MTAIRSCKFGTIRVLRSGKLYKGLRHSKTRVSNLRVGFLFYYSSPRSDPKLKPVIGIYWKSEPGKEVWGDF